MTAHAFTQPAAISLVDSFNRFCARAQALPHPGSGKTLERWRTFANIASEDLSLVKLAEAHADALSILAECGAPEPSGATRWGVWAANPPNSKLVARRMGDTLRLSGTKQWCSGARLVTHALVTCFDGEMPLLARVELDQRQVSPLPSAWANAGMSNAQTTAVRFENAEAKRVGDAGSYVSRPGFWQGAIGIAACWHGGAVAIAQRLQVACSKRDDAHAFTHFGHIHAALSASASALRDAAEWIDLHPRDDAQSVALSTRASVERSVSETIDRVGRALGAAPLCADSEHAQRVSDLTVFIRQSHAEHDLEALGRLTRDTPSAWQL